MKIHTVHYQREREKGYMVFNKIVNKIQRKNIVYHYNSKWLQFCIYLPNVNII